VRYEGRVVIVTGGTKGIGEGCVRAFVEAGSRVAFCARSAKEGEALARELSARGPGEAFFMRCDVAKVEEVERFVDATVERYGRLDCLVNNAGWHPPHKPIDEFSCQDLRDLMELNLVSMFAACKRALPHLRRSHGAIVTVGSKVVEGGGAGAAAYAVSKAGVVALTRVLALENKDHRVRVNCVMPGIIDTPKNRTGMPKADRSGWTPPAAIARVIVFLLSPESAPVSGGVVPVDAHA